MPDPADNLNVFLVGGAVRDEIMGLSAKDRDWVVVGTTPEEMAGLGFRPIGKNFPVFLHPVTKEEYALARTEKKVTQGYHGFVFNTSPDITLEQDLKRRDLTMNAIAKDRTGAIIDPFGGTTDIKNRVIRHVSESYREDPVRVLRTARFAARYAEEDFRVDRGTLELMEEMVGQGEVDALVPERVWQELSMGFSEKRCSLFFKVLRDCGALQRVLPEVDALFGIPQVAKFHPEIDTGVHTLMSLDAAQAITDDALVLFAVLVHDLGKACTPKEELPRHRGHEMRGLKPIENLCGRLGVPARFREFALKVCEYHLHCHMMHKLKPATVLKVLENFDGFRKPELIEKFAQACLADKRGRTGHENADGEAIKLLERYHHAAISVDAGGIAATVKDGSGRKIKKAIKSARISAISNIKKQIGV